MRTILVIEDELAVLEITAELIGLMGHRVLRASCGADVHALLETEKSIDLALLDLSLPDVDGLDLIPELLRHFPTLPIIVCSGDMPTEADRETFHGSIKEFLQKPFSLDTLKAVLKHQLPV